MEPYRCRWALEGVHTHMGHTRATPPRYGIRPLLGGLGLGPATAHDVRVVDGLVQAIVVAGGVARERSRRALSLVVLLGIGLRGE